MLYIDVEINGVKLQAFVDSGAQTSVISGKCAQRCDVLRLTDDRFAGKVVGVGTGQTLGRVHVVPLNIAGNYFPMSLTVMDDSQVSKSRANECLLHVKFRTVFTCFATRLSYLILVVSVVKQLRSTELLE
jgi:hypothetical protein